MTDRDGPKLTQAQRDALEALPVEVGAYMAPRRSTLRVLIRLGLAKETGDFPTNVIPTEAGRGLRGKWRADS
jgi:hypothetical protein